MDDITSKHWKKRIVQLHLAGYHDVRHCKPILVEHLLFVVKMLIILWHIDLADG